MSSEIARSKSAGPVVVRGLQVPADLGVLAFQVAVAAEEVDRAAFGDGHQPGAGVPRHPVGRPLLERRDDGVLG